MEGRAHEFLKEMGFKPVEEGSNVYVNGNLGSSEFDFSNRQNVEEIAACIWDTAQHYGEQKMKLHIINKLFRGI